MAPFTSPAEFRRVFDELFTLLSKDRDAGPRLRARKCPQRFVFPDVGLVLNVRDADEKRAKKGDHLLWVWGDEKRTWEPRVTLEMTSEVANRYFQGKENVALAAALGRIDVVDGDLRDVLDLLPIVLPFHPKWIRHLHSTGQLHLVV
jgi:hypothetical protein